MIQTMLFVAGLNTLFQTFFGTRLPAVIGGSYTYVPTTISIILAGRYSNIVDPQEVTSLKPYCFSFYLFLYQHLPDVPVFNEACRNLRG